MPIKICSFCVQIIAWYLYTIRSNTNSTNLLMTFWTCCIFLLYLSEKRPSLMYYLSLLRSQGGFSCKVYGHLFSSCLTAKVRGKREGGHVCTEASLPCSLQRSQGDALKQWFSTGGASKRTLAIPEDILYCHNAG